LAALAKFRFNKLKLKPTPNKVPEIALEFWLVSRLAEKEYFFAGVSRILKSAVSSPLLAVCSMLTNLHAPNELNRLIVFRYFCWLYSSPCLK
jgi:hypothetical protein